jgi:SAM-dependent methyltransferase
MLNRGMTFAIPGSDYDRFMGRYSTRLAPLFAEFAGTASGMRVLDVGCGPGALTAELVRRVGQPNVAGIEPSSSFFDACRERFPDADIRAGAAEHLPWSDGSFDAALSQLVLSFVDDADRVGAEMRRVVRAGGTLAACMWLGGTGMQMGHLFWEAATALEPSLRDRELGSYRREGEIAALFRRVGLHEVSETVLEVRVSYRDFDEFWQPMLHAAGSIGSYISSISDSRRDAIRELIRERLGRPEHAFELSGRASAARGRV